MCVPAYDQAIPRFIIVIIYFIDMMTERRVIEQYGSELDDGSSDSTHARHFVSH